MVAPTWELPFELMCDASDYALGAVLGQRHENHFQPVYYASKTLTDAQENYTTTEKELLAVVFAFDKFRSYLVLSKTIVYTDHSALKYLFAKQDAKPRLIRKKTYAQLSAIEKLQADCDCKATNVVLQGLPPDVYAIVNHHKVAKEIWDRNYWRFAQLINNMNVINMSMRAVQVNTKFLNNLPPEWSKFVIDVKLVRDLNTTNYDQLYSYLEQHEMHANETRLIRERYQDPLAFVANYHQSPSQLNNYHSQYNPT
ncbi:integrase, catalytic region, zinc finger, CCHC-type containing protein [Tanacetum coccineum]